MIQIFKQTSQNQKIQSRIRNNNAFTLIEIMAALAVVSIGMFAIMSTIFMIIKVNVQSKKVTTAVTLAENQIERIKDSGYYDVQTDLNLVLDTTYGANAIALDEGYGTIEDGTNTANIDYSGYRRLTVIFPDTPVPSMMTGSITVFWNTDNKSLSLVTTIAR